MNNFVTDLTARLDELRSRGQLRSLMTVEHRAGGDIVTQGKRYLNLAGNDYLGLATDAALYTAFYQAGQDERQPFALGLGSTASRLMTGNTAASSLFEQELASFYQKEAALLFNSGYHLNLGLLPALSTRDDLIVADKLCHASLIDGMRLSRAKMLRYPHLDYAAIERILARERGRYRQVFLVSESIFSMDGDCADLPELVRLKEKWGAVLYLDEAHGVGIRGETGRGLAEEQGVLQAIDLFVGTCGKAYGGMGAFVIGARSIIDYLVNTARSLIFSTGLAPVNVEWLRFVLGRLPQMQAERQHVAALANNLRQALSAEGLNTTGTSNIVPVFIGDAARTVAVAERVRQQGYWVTAIRPPTVPQGTSRLRLSLNASMNWARLAPLPGIIAQAMAVQPGKTRTDGPI